jgi:hypothetical protein
MKPTVPQIALDDRLAFIGTSGSGKTFAAKGLVERLLAMKNRVVVVDPLDVWFGLRLKVDGKTAAYNVAILGGRHADMPISEHSGRMIGDAVATATESCIVSLGQIKTQAGRQRFMLAFLDALYERTDPEVCDPYHVVFDEADLWAPQKPMKGEEMLEHLMEEIVRRGRVKGFIPWLITQRPAVLNKNVLSQADGLIAMKLTSSQDRDAIGAWIEGQADRQQGREILASLPTLGLGDGFVWMPAHSILERSHFPLNDTFDSSRTPKRGEKKVATELKPLDIGALRAQLATIEEESKANDPKKLKEQIVSLEKQLAESTSGQVASWKADAARYKSIADETQISLSLESARVKHLLEIVESVHSAMLAFDDEPHAAQRNDEPRTPKVRNIQLNGSLRAAQQKCLDAIAWWRKIGVEPVERDRACVVAGLSPTSSTFGVYLSELVKLGYVENVPPGRIQLTFEGNKLANTPTMATTAELRDSAKDLLGPKEQRVFDVIYEAWPNEISRDDVADALSLSKTSSTCGVYLSAIAKYGIIENGRPGHVKAAAWLFPKGTR